MPQNPVRTLNIEHESEIPASIANTKKRNKALQATPLT